MATSLKEHLEQLLQYDHWANDLIIEALIAHKITDEKLIYWMSHLMNTEKVWLERMMETEGDSAPHTVHALSDIPGLLENAHEELMDWLKEQSEESLHQTVHYTNSKGKPFENKMKDIFAHIINHSTHHRAQIAAAMRNMDIAPPATDYIFYMRKGV